MATIVVVLTPISGEPDEPIKTEVFEDSWFAVTDGGALEVRQLPSGDWSSRDYVVRRAYSPIGWLAVEEKD